jgi:hypothetical protein
MGRGTMETFKMEFPALQAPLPSQVGVFADCRIAVTLISDVGSAVYIFGIDQATSPSTSEPNIVFTLGSIQKVHHYTGTERFAYDALFFSATGLAPDQEHTVNWVFNFANTGNNLQVALFDYAVVSTGVEDVKSPNTPVITE